MAKKVSDLYGADLDYWTARADGFLDERKQDLQMIRDGKRILVGKQEGDFAKQHEYSPSTNWAQGGTIIDKYMLCYDFEPKGYNGREYAIVVAYPLRVWPILSKELKASVHKHGWANAEEPNAILTACMRAYVASVYVDEVPD
jgi:hypothetical protein